MNVKYTLLSLRILKFQNNDLTKRQHWKKNKKKMAGIRFVLYCGPVYLMTKFNLINNDTYLFFYFLKYLKKNYISIDLCFIKSETSSRLIEIKMSFNCCFKAHKKKSWETKEIFLNKIINFPNVLWVICQILGLFWKLEYLNINSKFVFSWL